MQVAHPAQTQSLAGATNLCHPAAAAALRTAIAAAVLAVIATAAAALAATGTAATHGGAARPRASLPLVQVSRAAIYACLKFCNRRSRQRCLGTIQQAGPQQLLLCRAKTAAGAIVRNKVYLDPTRSALVKLAQTPLQVGAGRA